jgi:mRNA interferase MazF
MTALKRGMIIDVDLESTKGSETGKIRPCVIVTNDTYNERVPIIQVVPLTEWNPKKARIKTNIEIGLSQHNGFTKRTIADCLQTRPVDHCSRMVRIRGILEPEALARIDQSLKVVFALD